ncbi:hypothetical protein N9L26_01050 [Candidatus Pacebacteria bacterium]|nr:hypothetical protein [Candidatus Paceibacterota bacterium]
MEVHMHFVPKITYPADGTNIFIGEDHYLNQRLAEDVPVTELRLKEVIMDFLYSVYNGPLRDAIRIQLSGGVSEDLTFLGERVLILDLLMHMLQNSKEAGASIFDLTVEHDEQELRLVVCDDGSGIDTSHLVDGVPAGYTKKALGWGWSLHDAAINITKIGASALYNGAGIDGGGARFVISFLRRMPKE